MKRSLRASLLILTCAQGLLVACAKDPPPPSIQSASARPLASVAEIPMFPLDVREKIDRRIEALSAAARSQMANIRARSEEYFYFTPSDDGRVAFISGSHLSPEPCASAAEGAGLTADMDEWYATIARCFIGESQAVFVTNSTPIDPQSLRRVSVTPFLPGEKLVELQQLHDGIRVEGARFKACFYGTEMITGEQQSLCSRPFSRTRRVATAPAAGARRASRRTGR